ncbi:MAG TPA: hypothetical protein VKA37_04765 [Halobacteriales archaeon]|nr:hypothetical protein [Halobacteriales archaeon]
MGDPSSGSDARLVTMPEEDAEEADPDEEEPAESEERIEDLFEGEGSEDDEGEDGDEDVEAVDEEQEESEAGESEDDEDSEDEEDDEVSGGDGSGGVVEAGASGIDEELLAVDDRTKPPEFAGAEAEGGWLSTGIDELDERLGGGIPPGRILSFVATADTQSELLVKHLVAQHDCLYLSTLRPKWEVEEEVRDYVQKSAPSSGGTDVHIEQLTPDSRLDSARRYVEELDGRTIVVIDSANELEDREKERYVYFIDELKRKLWETGSVGLFYCIEEAEPSEGRDVTLRRADLVWRLRQSDVGDGLDHELLVSKFRSGRALTEPLMLSLTDEVEVRTG